MDDAGGHGLRKELRLRDLVPMQILLVVGVTWAGIAAKQGSDHPVMWLAGVLFFFLPQVAVVTFCARLWPLEGGVYQWAKFALGPMVGFLSAWNYGFYAVLLVSTMGIQAVTSLSYALGPSAAWMVDSKGLTFACDAVLFAVVLGVNVVGLKMGRWVSHFGAAVMMVVTGTLLVLLVWHPGATAAHPHVSPQRPFAFGWPVWSILTLNLYIKVAFNALSGLEQVAVFAGETKDAARSVMLSAWIAAPAVVVIYVLMTSSMLTYVPSSQIDLAGPIPQVLAAALGSGAGVWLGRVMILGLMLFLVASYIIVVAETSRLPMVAGWDRMLPGWFSRVSPRFHTPVRSLLVIVAISGVASVLASIGAGTGGGVPGTTEQQPDLVWALLLRDVRGAAGGGGPVWGAGGFLAEGVGGAGAGGDGGGGGADDGSDRGGEQHVGIRREGGGGSGRGEPGGDRGLCAGAAVVDRLVKEITGWLERIRVRA